MKLEKEDLLDLLKDDDILKIITLMNPVLSKKLSQIKDINQIDDEDFKKVKDIFSVGRISYRLEKALSCSNVDVNLVANLVALSHLTDEIEIKNSLEQFLQKLESVDFSLVNELRNRPNDISQIIKQALKKLSDNMLSKIANTSVPGALRLISVVGVDVNQHSEMFGSNPLTLAIAKGYGHVNNFPFDEVWVPDKSDDERIYKDQETTFYRQSDVIDALLARDDIDVNFKHKLNGMTPLHIACLRGDHVELIQRLIEKGADLNALDDDGKTPLERLDESYETVQKYISKMTCQQDLSFGEINGSKVSENRSDYSTLPTRQERETNVDLIRDELNKGMKYN